MTGETRSLPPGEVQVPRHIAVVIDAITASMDAPSAAAEAGILLDHLEAQGFVLVDTNVQVSDDIGVALRDWLTYTRAPSGAFGQSMEATMAVDATRRLRAAAAKYVTAHSDEQTRGER